MSFDVWQALLSEVEDRAIEIYGLPDEDFPPDVVEITQAA